MHIVVVLPTYNEKENIVSLIPALQAIFSQMPHQMSLLVVDDNSPDGTAEVVRNFSKQYSNIRLSTGEKKGLGRAYTRGIEYALAELHADAVMEMDADLSHNPSDIPRLVSQLSDYDFVIGSRYIPGGKIPDEWSLFRKLNSRFGNVCARFIAGIYRIKDCTSGFRAIRASILEKIDLSSHNAEGYYFQVSLLYEALVHHAKIKEVPIEFADRTKGVSKLGITDIVEFIFLVWMVRLENSKVFLKFALVGFSGLFVNLGVMTTLLNMGINKFIASPVSIEISIISNFFLNNYWTFVHRKTQKKLCIKGLKFNIVSLLSLTISYSTFILLSFQFPRLTPQIAQAIGIAPAMLVNYFLNVYWTFDEEKKKET